MKTLLNIFLTLALVLALSATAFGATSNPSAGSTGYQIVTLPVATITAATTGVSFFKAPFPYRVVNVMSRSRAQSATTYSFDVLANGVSLLTSSCGGTTVAYTEATLTTTPNIADEASVTVNIQPGTNGYIADMVVEMVLKRL